MTTYLPPGTQAKRFS